MKIATYNVNGINGRLPVLLRWLAEAEPDIVCLQELKAPDARFPIGAITDAGYAAIWHGQKSWNGVAILSRVEHLAALPKDKPTPERRSAPTVVKEEGPPQRHSRKARSGDQDPSPRKALADIPRPEPQPAPRPKPRPKPSRAKLDEAERTIEHARVIQEDALAGIRRRQKALQDERRQLEKQYDADMTKLETAAGKARDRYRSALEKWRAQRIPEKCRSSELCRAGSDTFAHAYRADRCRKLDCAWARGDACHC